MGGNLIFMYIVALFKSAAQAIGGPKGALLQGIAGTAELIAGATEDVKEKVTPWFAWANSITDAGRDPTPEELAASDAFRDAVHGQNLQLAQNVPVDSLPPLPLPPGYTRDASGNVTGPDGKALGWDMGGSVGTNSTQAAAT